MKVISFILIFVILNASSYPEFSKKELENIKNNTGDISKNRVIDYIKTINSFKKLPKQKQLLKVNTYLNQLLPQYDNIIQNKEDYWTTPKEFLTIGYGDCEDYVIIKYFTLIKLGFDKNKLFMTTVKEKYSGSYHMVLSYFEFKNKAPLILDNLSFRILNLKTRDDLEADIFMNEKGSYKISEYKKLIKINNTAKKFSDLMKKVEKGL